MLSLESTVEFVLCVPCLPPTVGMSSAAVCRVSLLLSVSPPFSLSCVFSLRDCLRVCVMKAAVSQYECVCVSKQPVCRSSVTNKGFTGVLGSLVFPFS